MALKSERLQPGGKRIVVCCDGTWNEPEKASDDPKDKSEPTNVLKSIRAVNPLDSEGLAQISYYDEGVGTGWSDRLIGGGLGYGISANIQEAYRFIANNYRQGDHIFLFGFSRGAYTVRSVAGFINAVGLLGKRDQAFSADAYALYRTPPQLRATSPYRKALENKDILPPETVPIEFIGVWDTVGALGAPVPWLKWATKRWVGFHDTSMCPHVRHAYHALAIDERREPFAPSLWTETGEHTRIVQQVWFPGVHSNIGSGYPDTRLSSIVLNWLLHRACEHGLELLPFAQQAILGHSKETLAERARTGVLVDSMTLTYRTLGPYLREMGPEQFGAKRKKSDVVPGEMLHQSALDRLGVDAPVDTEGNLQRYAPENLSKAKETMPVAPYDDGLPVRAGHG